MRKTKLGCLMSLCIAAVVIVAVGWTVQCLTKYTPNYSHDAHDAAEAGMKLRLEHFGYMRRLQEIQNKGRLNSADILEAQHLTWLLEDHYGDLGIKIERKARQCSSE